MGLFLNLRKHKTYNEDGTVTKERIGKRKKRLEVEHTKKEVAKKTEQDQEKIGHISGTW